MAEKQNVKTVSITLILKGELAEKFEIVKAAIGARRNTDVVRQSIERTYNSIKPNKREALLNELIAKLIIDEDGELNTIRAKAEEIKNQYGGKK